MAKIEKIIAREILNSQGYPTVEAIVQLSDKSIGIFSTPSGITRGKYEAVEVVDHTKRFKGFGLVEALKKIHSQIAPKLIGQEAGNLAQIDQIMIALDGTADKQNLGANIILALSGAICKAQAASLKMPVYQYVASMAGLSTREFLIPTPMFNLINGGKHGNGNLDFQEFLVVPRKSSSYSANLRMGAEIYYALRDVLKGHSAIVLVGVEGGYAPTLYSNMDALKVLSEAVTAADYKLGLDVFFSIDAAGAYFKSGNSYRIKDRPVSLSPSDLVEFYLMINEQYHLLSIEDPFAEDDWDQWKTICSQLGAETLIVGDDLIATNLQRLTKAVEEKACNAIIIKPNQVGTISETLAVVKAARSAGFKIIVSHRAGETNDDFIADFGVGVGADYIKFGAPARGERVAKYNRLLEIEHDLS